MSEPKLNDAVTEALGEILERKGNHVILKPLPAPCTHGYFNRRMFLEAFLFQAGAGVSISPEDIKEYAGVTDREFDTILKEYIAKGVVLKQPNPFGADQYKLDMREVNKQATP